MRRQDWQTAVFVFGLTLALAGCAREVSRSSIAGTWTIDPAVISQADPLGPESRYAGKVWVPVRGDGTFDWSGTLKDHVYHFDRLRRAGDCSFSDMDPETQYRILWAKYDQDVSTVAILVTASTDGGSTANEMLMQEVRHVDKDHVRYWLARVVPGGPAILSEYMLTRARQGAERLEPFYALPSSPAAP